jgi:carboxypeptidase family protein
MLTLDQSREYNRFKKLSGFFANNGATIATFIPFKTEVDSYNLHFQSLDALIPNKGVATVGITSEKASLKEKIANELGLACKKTRSYALLNNHPQLALATNTRADKILRMKDSEILAFTQSIQTLVTPVLANPDFIPYNITAATLTGIVTDATSFNGMIGKANTTAAAGTTANTAINVAIKNLCSNITHFDLLVDEFESSNTAFIQGYHINSSIDTTGMHHSGIEGTITSKATAQPIANATITISALNKTDKTFTTDMNGYYHADRISTGDYTITIAATGFTSQTLTHHIVRGKIDEVDVAL